MADIVDCLPASPLPVPTLCVSAASPVKGLVAMGRSQRTDPCLPPLLCSRGNRELSESAVILSSYSSHIVEQKHMPLLTVTVELADVLFLATLVIFTLA